MTDTSVAEYPAPSLERCDSCNAAGAVHAIFVNGSLFFCGHHARANYVAITKSAVHIHDPNNAMVFAKSGT